MAMYSSEPNRSVPQDERSEGGWQIIRNGDLFGRRRTLGAARSVISNAKCIAGDGEEWRIIHDDGTEESLTFIAETGRPITPIQHHDPR